MNNPSTQNFSSPGTPTPPPTSQAGGLQDIGAKQSGFVSQFVNGSAPTQTPPMTTQQPDPQIQYSQASQPLYTQQPTNTNSSTLPPLNNNPVDLGNRDFVVGATSPSVDLPSASSVPSTGYPNDLNPVRSMSTNDFQAPVVNNMPQVQQPVYLEQSSTQSIGFGQNPPPGPVDLPVQNQPTYTTSANPPFVGQADSSQVTVDNSLGTSSSYNPTQDMQAVQPPMSPPVFDQAQVSQVVEPKQEENSVIGTHQVAINEDYADNYNPNYQQQPQPQTFQPYAAKPVEPKGIDFSRPSTIASVNQTFADTTQFSDDGFTSTNLLSGFDDSNNSMLPMVSDDDDDDLFADDDDADTVAPYGFSDFDPNEQVTVQAHVSDFDSHGLQEVAEDINADFSENFYTNPKLTQTVGVLTQEPAQQPAQPQVQQIFSYSSQIEPNSSNPHYVERKYTQIEPQIEPVVAHTEIQTSSELSPAARLNQLLEAEEEAEKVIIQKQNQLLNQSAKPKTIKSQKESIFQQLDPDASLQGDIRSGMASAKPGSRYFLIVSLVVLISVIGFLLVLLGLTLI